VTIREAADKWGISRQRVHALVKAGRIPGAILLNHGGIPLWAIPSDAAKPDAERPGTKPKKNRT